jgi:hypothetical protein
MKFYETYYEDYIHSSDQCNMHPELIELYDKFPESIGNFGNLIIYGASGVGKYTQMLNIIKKYSPSVLKYDKKIKVKTEKHSCICRISDIHYEVDMSLLGCNSKILWHEIFFQIVDIISVKSDKKGIIVCKNFHNIHGELLEVFYSYIQQYNYPNSSVKIKFIIITEHVSFIPNNIINSFKIISIKRPSKEVYIDISSYQSYKPPKLTIGNDLGIYLNNTNNLKSSNLNNQPIISRSINLSSIKNEVLSLREDKNASFIQRITQPRNLTIDKKQITDLMRNIDSQNITNIKEIKSFNLLNSQEDIPDDIFDIICGNIINQIENYDLISFTVFRDIIYDILIYNLDAVECLWYIITYFIKNNRLSQKSVSEILSKTFLFLKYYNNNYRPIYHLESILFYIIIKIYGLNELQ